MNAPATVVATSNDGMANGYGFYKTGFFMLAGFILGNALSFIVWGLHVVSSDQFDKSNAAITIRLDRQDEHMRSIDTNIANLTGQLSAKKVIQNP